jgi:hypothetical protein
LYPTKRQNWGATGASISFFCRFIRCLLIGRLTDYWCGRGDSNPHPLTGSRFSYHFDFRRRLVGVRGLDYPFAIAFGRRRRPSSLYTFPLTGAWLGIGLGRSVSFPRIWAVLLREFPRGHSIEVCCVYRFATSAFAESFPFSCHSVRRRARAMSRDFSTSGLRVSSRSCMRAANSICNIS